MNKVEETAAMILPIKKKLKTIYTELSALRELVNSDIRDETEKPGANDEQDNPILESLAYQEKLIGYALSEIEGAVADLSSAIKESAE